jgi:hypothetical protein
MNYIKNPRLDRIDAYIVKMHTAMEAEPRDPEWADACIACSWR